MAPVRKYRPARRPPLQPRVELIIEQGGRLWLSQELVTLLEAIDACGSISAAAKHTHRHYRQTWEKVTAAERAVGRKLLRRQAGGTRGGGTRLTPAGRRLVAQFRRFAAGLERQVVKRFERVFLTRAG